MRFYPLRFRFRAEQPVTFPPVIPANILRGAFGTIFRQLACVPDCSDSNTCGLRAKCAYARIFEPRRNGDGPSGLADPPRPFVFRARHLDGSTIAAGSEFCFEVNLFEIREPAIEYFRLTFEQLAHEGLGTNRARATLLDLNHPSAPIEIPLTPVPAGAERVRVRFLTPTELKQDSRPVLRPEFAVLFSRIRDRLSTLSDLYGDGPLDIDFKGMAARASSIQMTHCATELSGTTRHSSRTNQTHPLSGFTGEAVYEGDLAEFLPYLDAAVFTGVGRQTVWGKGEIAVER